MKKRKNQSDIMYFTIIGLMTALMYVVGIIFEKGGLGAMAFSFVKVNPAEGFVLIPLVLLGFKASVVTAVSYLLLMAVSGVGFSSNPAGVGFFAMAIALFSFIFGYVIGSAITRTLKPLVGKLGDRMNDEKSQFIRVFVILWTLVIGYLIGMFITEAFTDALDNNSRIFWNFAIALLVSTLLTLAISSRFNEPYRGHINLIFSVVFVTIVMTTANFFIITPSFALGKWTTVWEMMDKFHMSYSDVWAYIIAPPAGIIHGNIIKYISAAMVAAALMSSKLIWKYKIVNTKSGNPRAANSKRIAIIAGEFRKDITDMLIEGIKTDSENYGWKIDVYWVNGAWEMPLMYKGILAKNKYVGSICVGQIISGTTTTYAETMSHIVRDKMIELSLKYDNKLTFGLCEGSSADEIIKIQTNKNRLNEGVYAARALQKLFDLNSGVAPLVNTSKPEVKKATTTKKTPAKKAPIKKAK